MEGITFMNIKVGEYVRTKTGFIGKVIGRHRGYGLHYEIDVKKEIQDNMINGIVHEDNILKHSENIIDLIEVGDIIEIQTGLYNKYKITLEDEDTLISIKESLKNWAIKAILTKEQYAQNCYKLEVQNEQ